MKFRTHWPIFVCFLNSDCQVGSSFWYILLRVDCEATVKNAAKSFLCLRWCTIIFLVCLEFYRGIKNKNKTKKLNEALAVKSAMPLSFVWFCCSAARTKPYKKYYKKDQADLYQ